VFFSLAASVVGVGKTGGVASLAGVGRATSLATKAAKEEGKKQREIQAAAEAAMGLTAEQLVVFKETEELLGKVRVEIGKMMTPEQMAKLPEQAQNSFKEKTGKGKKATQ
jgi:hypothetical protein